MKQKTVEVPCHYIIDQVTLMEISECFKHHINEWENANLPKFFDYAKWGHIKMNYQDVQEISKNLNSDTINIAIRESQIYNLKIHPSKDIPQNEIYFY